jgi:hypothetical protein
VAAGLGGGGRVEEVDGENLGVVSRCRVLRSAAVACGAEGRWRGRERTILRVGLEGADGGGLREDGDGRREEGGEAVVERLVRGSGVVVWLNFGSAEFRVGKCGGL